VELDYNDNDDDDGNYIGNHGNKMMMMMFERNIWSVKFDLLIYREFLNELLKAGFDPNIGFFKATNERLLYPNPQVKYW
jgi:hypothetical protein